MDSGRRNRVLAFDRFRLDLENLLLYHDGEELNLPPKVVKTLAALAERHGEVISKDDLLESVWPDSVVNESSITQHLYILRKAMGDRPEGGPYIETLRRRGYRFLGTVEAYDRQLVSIPEKSPFAVNEMRPAGNVLRLADWTSGLRSRAASDLAAGSKPPLGDPIPERTTISSSSRKVRLRTLAVFTGVAAAGVILAWGYWFSGRSQTDEAAFAAGRYNQVNVTRMTTSGRTQRSAISPDGDHIAHVTDDSDGQSLWVRHVAAPNDVRIAGPEETEYVSVTFAPDGGHVFYAALDRDKGEVALFRVPVLGGPPTVIASDVGPISFSPDGSKIAYMLAFGREESHLFVADPDGKNKQSLAVRRFPDYFQWVWNSPAWSPDGKLIYAPVRVNDEAGAYDTIIGFGVEDRSEHRPITSRWQFVGQPICVSDGLLVTGSESATDPMQVWHVAAASGAVTRVTNDLNNYFDLSVTADGGRITAVQSQALSSVWVASNDDSVQAKQIGSEVGRISDLSWTPDDRILYRPSGSSEIWTMSTDGEGPKQLTVGAAAERGLDVSADGSFVVFSSSRGGRFHIWRTNIDGSDPLQLTAGDGEFFPKFSPDGRWIVYQSGNEIDPTVWKVSIDGGDPVRLSDTKAQRPAVSPDGRFVAYHYLDPEPEGSKWRVGVVPMDGSRRLKWFDFPRSVTQRNVRWKPDGRSIVYSNESDGVYDLWEQPLKGGKPRRMTELKSDQILTFGWSRDGRQLAYVRSIATSNVVLLDFKDRSK